MKTPRVRVSKNALLTLLPLLFAVVATAQMVSVPENDTCKGSSTVTVTVFLDKSVAVIPNAFVLLRGGGLGKGKPFQLELATNAEGRAIASVPCGYVDVFATATNFAPNAEKVLILEDKRSIAISLKLYPITQY